MSSAEEIETLHHTPVNPLNSHALSSGAQMEAWGVAIDALANRAAE